jgi:quercetin 2,3-dioxygenase
MKSIIHRAGSRGHFDHGWLDTSHSFSFADYYDPDRLHFGLLRVLNDDVVAPGEGFGRHPHDNMEIITIPLQGALEHADSMGFTKVINSGDVQIMSAGSGIEHSEYNPDKENLVNFLQIWIFPKEKNIKPRYEQITFDPAKRFNKFQRVVSPSEKGALRINQDAYLSLASLDKDGDVMYKVNKEGNGVYFFLIEGKAVVGGVPMNRRDGLGIWDAKMVPVRGVLASEILAIEVPMH